jgi:methionine-R-sulfoxide reductase
MHTKIYSCPNKYDKNSKGKGYSQNFLHETEEEVRKLGKISPEQFALGDWNRILSLEQFKVTRLNCTERRHTSPLNEIQENGVFHCVSCGNPLFDFQSKYNSGSGWPSFFQPIRSDALKQKTVKGYARTDIHCARCGAHLGPLFHDGPLPTGLRYCMNGLAMDFVKEPST